jgi:TolA-binding protein
MDEWKWRRTSVALVQCKGGRSGNRWRFLALIAFASLTLAQASLAQNVSKNQRAKLKKIDDSIKITQEKLRSQRDTKFAADLLFMLAELYYDKAILTGALTPVKSDGTQDQTGQELLLKEALEQYRLIEERYPDYGSLPRVMFNRAMLQKALGQEKEFVDKLKTLTSKFPDSDYAAQAQIELGNHFLEKGDYEFALEFFDKVLSHPNLQYRFKASLKKGLALQQLEKWVDSLQAFEKVYTAAEEERSQFPLLVEDALVGSVYPLLELNLSDTVKNKQWQRPIEYYKGLGLPPSMLHKALGRLATRYELKKKNKESALVYFELFFLATSPTEQKAAFENAYLKWKSLKENEFPPGTLEQFSRMILKMHSSLEVTDLKKDLANYEAVFRDLLTSEQKKLLQTKRKDELLGLAERYEDYLFFYPKAAAAPLMKLNLAEVYYLAEQYHLAGRYYFEAYQSNHSEIKKDEVLKSALQAYEEGAANLKQESMSLLQCQTGYRNVASEYLKRFPSDKKIPDIEYNIGKIIYDEQSFSKAAEYLLRWLQKYPRHKNAETAALLYLDTFYVTGQLKELPKAADRVNQIAGLDGGIKSKVKSISQGVQLKTIRSIAGEFGSKEYAEQFVKFARKNKNSQLGEQALFEAFASLRAKGDPGVYELGEEYVATYPNTARGKEVYLSLTQIALERFEYQKAARYLAGYAEKYPSDSNARAFAEQAGFIFATLGQWKESSTSYEIAGNMDKALEVLARSKNWKLLQQKAQKVSGALGAYYQGLALWRQGDQANSLRLFEQVMNASPSSPEMAMKVGHAAVIVGQSALPMFLKDASGQIISQEFLQKKTEEYVRISQAAEKAIQSGGGRWMMGGYYLLAQIQRGFIQILRTARPPAGVSTQQLQAALQPQVESYQQALKELLTQVQQAALQNRLVTRYTQGVLSGQGVTEEQEASSPVKLAVGAVSESLASRIKQNPKDLNNIMAVSGQLLAEQKNGTALMLLFSAMEWASEDPELIAHIAAAFYVSGDRDQAETYARMALNKRQDHSLALIVLGLLAQDVGFQALYQDLKAKVGAVSYSRWHPRLRL